MNKFVILIALIYLCSFRVEAEFINPIVCDYSFYEQFKKKPSASDDEDLRIRTHLNYVYRILKKRSDYLPEGENKKKRYHLLSLLKTYIRENKFPKNESGKNRRSPCFIDSKGNICAVGYLLAKTAGRYAAEEINKKYCYDAIADIDDPILAEWMKNSGFTEEECAMIQPFYGTPANVQRYLGVHLGGAYQPLTQVSGKTGISLYRTDAFQRKLSLRSISAFYEFMGKRNYSMSGRYAFGIYPVLKKFYYTEFILQPMAAISPLVYFENRSFNAVYLRPELGLALMVFPERNINPTMLVSYGYDVLLYHKSLTDYRKHRINLLLGTAYRLPKNRRLSRPRF